jgi:hypothetical protein
MRTLKICLWIAGVVCLLSVSGMFLPFSTFESIAGAFGVESLPDSPLFLYMIRVMSASYVGVGVFFVILALHPLKYGVMVPFSGLAAVFVGIVCWVMGLVVRMPVLWFLGDSLSCLVLGILILIFWQKAKKTPLQN